MPSRAILRIALAIALCACKPAAPPPDPAAQAAARESAAAPVLSDFEQAYAAREWDIARVKLDELKFEHAGTRAQLQAEARRAEVEGKADALREESRLKRLWDYQTNPAGKGEQISAALWSKDDITLGGGTSKVQLIFRDHPEWKRSTYIVLQRGDIDCYSGCKVKVTLDGKARMLDGLRPDTREAISMFINPDRALWRALRGSHELAIEVPVKGGPRQTAHFKVGGLDVAKMPAAWSR